MVAHVQPVHKAVHVQGWVNGLGEGGVGLQTQQFEHTHKYTACKWHGAEANQPPCHASAMLGAYNADGEGTRGRDWVHERSVCVLDSPSLQALDFKLSWD